MEKIADLKGRYKIKEENLLIDNTVLGDEGTYTCRNEENGDSAEIQVVGKDFLEFGID